MSKKPSCNTCMSTSCSTRDPEQNIFCRYTPTPAAMARDSTIKSLPEDCFIQYYNNEIIIKVPHQLFMTLNRIHVQDAESNEIILRKFADEDSGFFPVVSPSSECSPEIDYDDSYLDNGSKDPTYERVEKLIDARGNIQKVLGI